MKKYLLIYHAPAEVMAGMATATDEQKAESMKPWFAWKDKLGDQLVDFGAPLMGGQRLLPDGSSKDSTKEVTGYSIIKANSMEDAKTLLSGHPHLHGGCDIEVHETIAM